MKVTTITTNTRPNFRQLFEPKQESYTNTQQIIANDLKSILYKRNREDYEYRNHIKKLEDISRLDLLILPEEDSKSINLYTVDKINSKKKLLNQFSPNNKPTVEGLRWQIASTNRTSSTKQTIAMAILAASLIFIGSLLSGAKAKTINKAENLIKKELFIK